MSGGGNEYSFINHHSLSHDHSAVHLIGLAGDVVGVSAGKEHGHANEVFGRLRPTHWDSYNALLPGLTSWPTFQLRPLTVDERPHLRVDDARADRVHSDSWGKADC